MTENLIHQFEPTKRRREFNEVSLSKSRGSFQGNSASLPAGEAGFLPRSLEARNKPLIAASLAIIFAGILTGYLLAAQKTGKGVIISRLGKESEIIGSKDSSVFKDSAVGVIEKGGLEGEGTHKLIREGGPSQTAYLTSSVLNLDNYIDKKVKVWGETFAAQKVAWLMDVGRIEVLE